MDLESKELVLKYNLMRIDPKNYVGLLDIEATIYKLMLQIPKYPNLDNIKLQIFQGTTSIEVADILQNKNGILSISTLLESIECHLRSQHKLFNTIDTYADPEISIKLNSILQQTKHLQNRNYQVQLKPDCTEVNIVNITGNDKFFMKLKLTDKNLFNVVEHSLPELCARGEGSMFPMNSTIEQHAATFERYLEQLEDFYSNMEAIDQLCFVVDPNPVTTKSVHRIFKYCSKIYIRIDVNPLSASAVTVKLIGPSDEIEPLRQKYNEKMTEWDIDLDIHKNLLRIFEILYFPMPTEEADQIRCSICYMYRLENQIPIVSCDNEQCDLVFHFVCLREWFATLIDSKTFLTITMGSCPYCKAKLSASFAHLLQN